MSTLDAGEAAAIPLAEKLGAALLCDDAGARAIARQRGLIVLGTLGLLLRAKNEGELDRVAPVIEKMSGMGMYTSPELVAEVLRAAGESESRPK